MKDYLLKLLTLCAPDNGFAQDAIEYAILADHIRPTSDLLADMNLVMENYDAILATYRSVRARHEQILEASYGPLLAAINPRPRTL